jgi:hypothetical protein
VRGLLHKHRPRYSDIATKNQCNQASARIAIALSGFHRKNPLARFFRKKPHIAPGAHFRASNTGIAKTARPTIYHAVTWVRENG